MASTLCVRDRDDIRISPGIVEPPDGILRPSPSPHISPLVELMRATCLDVAESATDSDIQLVDSTICVARAIKRSYSTRDAVVDQYEAVGLPEDLEDMTRDKVVVYTDSPFIGFIRLWKENCTLPALMHMRPGECSDASLTMLHDDLLRRSTSRTPSKLGALLDYRIVMFEANQFYLSDRRRHAYLFEAGIVVMSDRDVSFTPISMGTKHEHPLELIHVIYLLDVATIVPSHTVGSSVDYIYNLTFKHRGQGSDLSLWFNNISAALDWAIKVRRIQYRNDLEECDPAETEDMVAFESFAAMMQEFRWQLALAEPLGRVHCYGTVTVHNSDKDTGRCLLVLFDHVLVFIQGSPPDAERHLLASRITSVARTMVNNEVGIVLTYNTEYEGCIQFEVFRFEPVSTETDAHTWFRALRTFAPNASTLPEVHQKLRSLSRKHHPSMPARVPEENSTEVAGLAMLHGTSIPDELNISVAVLPSFESDGLATYLLAYILEVAFEKFDVHRVQARVVHSSTNPSQTARAIRVLIHLGFTHEGVRRRAAIHPTEEQWADVTVLAMLQLDWITRAGVAPIKGTLWDEMFARHQRDREILLGMEGSQPLKRTRSMETVRDLHTLKDAIPSASMVSSSVGCPTVTSDTSSQVSVPATISSWSEISDGSSLHAGGAKVASVASVFSADDAADEYEEWDLEEDYSDEDNEDEQSEPKE